MLKKVRIFLRTERYGVAAQLFEDVATGMSEADVFVNSMLEPQDEDEGPQSMEMYSDARLRLTDDMFSLSYEESELTGMEGSTTSIGFQRQEPSLVSMIRTGIVRTALIFEQGKRHTSIYTTPFSEMELCVRALSVENRLLTEGSMTLDYLIEIHGLQAERCRMQISVHDDRP